MDQFKKSIRKAIRRPAVAALLSFFLPGVGQAAAGQRERGTIIMIPALALLASALVIAIFQRSSLFNSALDKTWLTCLLIVDLVALLYHLWAVIDAYLVAGKAQVKQRRPGAATGSMAASLVMIVILVGTGMLHGYLAYVDLGVQTFIDKTTGDAPAWADTSDTGPIAITSDNGDQSVVSDDPNASPTSSKTSTPGVVGTFDPGQLPQIDSPAEAKNWAADGQLNILLVGVDAGLGGGRSKGLRPDTMMVLHTDIKSGKAALIGVPRNLTCVPLPADIASHYPNPSNNCPAKSWPQMLNWFANEAGWNHPGYFSFYQGSGLEYKRAITATQLAIGTLTGLTIDGYIVINLMGLVNLIDAVGGITINVPTQTYDKPCGKTGTWEAAFRVCNLTPPHDGYGLPQADGKGPSQQMKDDAANSGGKQSISWTSSNGYDIAFTIKPGVQHMGGDWALAYARTRIYTTDYDRIKRQQLVLKSLRSSLDPCAMLPRLKGILDGLGDALWMNMPLNDISQWAGMAKYITGGNVKTITLDPATIGGSTYIDNTEWNKIKDLVAHSLDNVPAATGGNSGGGGFSC